MANISTSTRTSKKCHSNTSKFTFLLINSASHNMSIDDANVIGVIGLLRWTKSVSDNIHWWTRIPYDTLGGNLSKMRFKGVNLACDNGAVDAHNLVLDTSSLFLGSNTSTFCLPQTHRCAVCRGGSTLICEWPQWVCSDPPGSPPSSTRTSASPQRESLSLDTWWLTLP